MRWKDRPREEPAARYLARDSVSTGRAFTRSTVDVLEWRDGHPFFWWATEGQGHRVYDIAIVNGYVRKVPYESRRATHRVFVVPAGHQWRYTFDENDLRTITVGELGRQRAAAVYHPGKNQHGANSRMTT